MKKDGIVVAVKQADVVIRAERESSCSSCAGKAACGTLGSWDINKKDKNQFDITLPNSLNAKIGDVVTVEVPDQLILTASMMFYGLPVFAFLILGALSFVLAEKFGLSGDLFSALGGMLGAGLTWSWLMKRPNNLELPTMIAVQRK